MLHKILIGPLIGAFILLPGWAYVIAVAQSAPPMGPSPSMNTPLNLTANTTVTFSTGVEDLAYLTLPAFERANNFLIVPKDEATSLIHAMQVLKGLTDTSPLSTVDAVYRDPIAELRYRADVLEQREQKRKAAVAVMDAFALHLKNIAP